MATTLNNYSTSLNSASKQIYEVPTGKTAIVLNIAIAPSGESVKVLLYKQSGDDIITLIPGKLVPISDVYSPPLDKLILLPGEKVFARAVLESSIPVAIAWIGIPAISKSNNSDLASISFSIAEKDA